MRIFSCRLSCLREPRPALKPGNRIIRGHLTPSLRDARPRRLTPSFPGSRSACLARHVSPLAIVPAADRHLGSSGDESREPAAEQYEAADEAFGVISSRRDDLSPFAHESVVSTAAAVLSCVSSWSDSLHLTSPFRLDIVPQSRVSPPHLPPFLLKRCATIVAPVSGIVSILQEPMADLFSPSAPLAPISIVIPRSISICLAGASSDSLPISVLYPASSSSRADDALS